MVGPLGTGVPTAAETARAVRDGRVSPAEAVGQALAAIAELDGPVRAFQHLRFEAARAEAMELAVRPDLTELPLAGVPVAVKDVVEVGGECTVAGWGLPPRGPAPDDHAVVRRLRAAGAVVVGTTRVPEACLWPTTDANGVVTRNPWDGGFSAGGSSGGSGAAVAAGMVPVAHGTDGLGSVRIPASACGLVGVKPGRGVISPVGLAAGDWSGLTEHGALATTVQDAALLLSVLARRPELADVEEPEESLRIAVSVTPPVRGARVDREVVRATFGIAAAFMGAGDRVRRTGPRYPLVTGPATVARWFAAADAEVRAAGGREVRGALLRRTRRHAALGRLTRVAVRAREAEVWAAQAAEFFAGHDLLLTPVLATGPLRAAEWSRRPWLANVATSIVSTGGFAAAWNLAGFPAVAVPAGTHPRTGLPIGVQLVGPPGSEHTLLAAAATIERLRPWPRTARVTPG